jgi:uncharacterized protein YecT (DUF1311 family)
MKNNKKNTFLIFTAALTLLLTACASAESTAALDNHSQNNNSRNDNEDTSNINSLQNDANSINNAETLEIEDNDGIEKEVNTNNVSAEEEENNSNIVNAEEELSESSRKEEYLKKLSTAKIATEELAATDTSTYALKKVENDRWDIWDKLLNDIYGVLKEQLSKEEMDKLRVEQREWIKYRDNSAAEASKKYKGGTQEQLEYVAVLANLTEERSYVLVKDYMK